MRGTIKIYINPKNIIWEKGERRNEASSEIVFCTSYHSLTIIKATTRRIAGEIHIVPIPSLMERTPPIPAPMANIKIIPKKCNALYRDPFSFVLKYCDRLSVPLLRLPIHIVLAYPYP